MLLNKASNVRRNSVAVFSERATVLFAGGRT